MNSSLMGPILAQTLANYNRNAAPGTPTKVLARYHNGIGITASRT